MCFMPITSVHHNGSDRLTEMSGLIRNDIITTPITILNRSGKKLAAFLDRRSDAGIGSAMVILVPGYGRTKSSHLRLAYYLALNGFCVARYDHSNHVGDSDGNMLFTTLGQMDEDLISVIDYAETVCVAPLIGLVAESLGARVALKRVAKDERIKFFVSLIGVFDVQDTLRLIYTEDGFTEKSQGIVLGIRDIMGFQVDADRFIDDAYENEFHSLETSMIDASRLSIPSFFFVAEKDPWVSQHAIRSVMSSCPEKTSEFHLLMGIMHDLYENPGVAADTCGEIVRAAKRTVAENSNEIGTVRTPSEKIIVSRSRLEKRASSKDLKTAEERLFWAEYLERYSYIIKLQDYWNLLDLIGSKLGHWNKNERILDAGCGIGNFGAFLLVRNLYQALQLRTASLRRKPWAQYVGVDFVQSAIRQARDLHSEIYGEFAPKVEWVTHGTPLIDFSYSVLDLNVSLPFKDKHFDKIVSNLVLSYVKDPQFTLGEMYRTLREGGRIVISSLKPNADLSQIYRNYISVSRSTQEMEQARMVLSNASLIKHKEAEGFYQFFSEEQLGEFLQKAGCENITSWRSFGDQANIAVGAKPGH